MNQISFQLIKQDGLNKISITIDEQDLMGIIKSAEQSFTYAVGHFDLAGSYDLLVPQEFKEYFLESQDRKIIFGCSCGEVSCWPLYLDVLEKEEVIVWKNFKQGFRDWKYNLEFNFDKKVYKEELERLILQIQGIV